MVVPHGMAASASNALVRSPCAVCATPSAACVAPVITHGGKPVNALPGQTLASASMVPGAPAQVKAEPARSPCVSAVPSGGPGGGEAVTVAVAKPETSPLVARTVLTNVPGVVPAVNKPVLPSMVPPPATTDHVGAGEIATIAPVASWPSAVYWIVPPTTAPPGLGVTDMAANSPGAVTVTVAKPSMPPLVARTVFWNVPVPVPAVNKPVLPSMAPPPATTDQVGVIATRLLSASLPVAANGCFALMARDCGLGVTVIVVKTLGDVGALCSHATASSAAKGMTTKRRAASRRGLDMWFLLEVFARGAFRHPCGRRHFLACDQTCGGVLSANIARRIEKRLSTWEQAGDARYRSKGLDSWGEATPSTSPHLHLAHDPGGELPQEPELRGAPPARLPVHDGQRAHRPAV